jgi:hypothetical protein
MKPLSSSLGAFVILYGCGGSPGRAASDGGGGGSGSGSDSESSADVGSDSPSDASEAGPAVTVDSGPQSDPDIAYSVTLKMDPFTVGPGQEVYMCQSYANPFQGQQVDIKTYELYMAQGSHHMFVFYLQSAPDSSVVPCPQGGVGFAPFTFTGQTQKATQTYPEGVGATIPTTIGFYLNAHYINSGATAIQGQVRVTMSIAKPGVITQHAGVIFLNNTGLTVPPTNQPYVATKSFTLQQDVNILSSGSHMHKRATNFVATTSTGVTLFQTAQWAEPPPRVYSPPLLLPSGTTITWSCTYVNDTSAPLTFGESAIANVMCIGVNPFYPVSDIANPVLGSLL